MLAKFREAESDHPLHREQHHREHFHQGDTIPGGAQRIG